MSSAGLLDRMNFAIALAHDRVPGVKVDVSSWQWLSDKDPIALARAILDEDPSDQTKAAISSMLTAEDLQKQLAENARAAPPSLASLVVGLSLGSPEFQRR